MELSAGKDGKKEWRKGWSWCVRACGAKEWSRTKNQLRDGTHASSLFDQIGDRRQGKTAISPLIYVEI